MSRYSLVSVFFLLFAVHNSWAFTPAAARISSRPVFSPCQTDPKLNQERQVLTFPLSATTEPNQLEASGQPTSKTNQTDNKVETMGLSDGMKERLMREAATCSNPYMGRRRSKGKFTQVNILAAAALIVLIGGHGILY